MGYAIEDTASLILISPGSVTVVGEKSGWEGWAWLHGACEN